MRSRHFFLLALILASAIAKGQTGFMAGSSNVSIEPDHSVFSVALAGYGAPREGRFSLTWQLVSQVEDFTAVTSLNNKLYGITNQKLLMEGQVTARQITWTKVGAAPGKTALCTSGRSLIVANGEQLWKGQFIRHYIKWTKCGKVNNLVALTALFNKLFVATTGNELLLGTLTANKVKWTKTGSPPHIVSMASDGKKLYAINSGDTLWAAKPVQNKTEWTEIGRNNGLTFNIGIKHIVVLKNRLYAISNDDKLYIAEHRTNNNLSSRALAIRHKGKTIVLVGVDVTGFNHSLIEEIKRSVFQKHHIPPAAIMINASHTHFAPVTQAWLTWGDFCHYPDSAYLFKAKAAIIRSIELALARLQPSTLLLGRGETNIGLNRRGANRPHDQTLDVLKVQNNKKQVSSVLFLTACHPVHNNADTEAYTLNANYPGVSRKIIEDSTQAQNAIFIQGCGGDINPRSMSNVQTGQELAANVINVLHNDMNLVNGNISYAIDKVELPIKPWGIDSIKRFRALNADKIGDVEAEKNVRWSDLMVSNYKNGTVASSLPFYIQTINIGNWKIVGLSREVVNEYGPAVRALWPNKMVTVAGYCNDVSSYMPVSWHIENKFYEGYSSFLWYGQHGIPPSNIKDIIIDHIKTLNK